MGSIVLPTSGLVYIDAQVVIYSVERRQPYASILQPFWDAVQAGTAKVLTSKLAILETLVILLRTGDGALVSRYDGFFVAPNVVTVEISDVILRHAASLRARFRALKSPDAIHAATAMQMGAQHVVTNDRDMQNVGLPSVLYLNDLIASP